MLSGGEGFAMPQDKETEPENSTKNIIKNMVKEEKRAKLWVMVKSGWDTFNKYLVCAIIAALIGISIGVKVCQKFYSDKMDDATLAGSMVFKAKAYLITPKI